MVRAYAVTTHHFITMSGTNLGFEEHHGLLPVFDSGLVMITRAFSPTVPDLQMSRLATPFQCLEF